MQPELHQNIIEWSALEHQPLERSADWFWALGIVTVAAAVAAIILGDFLFGVLILVAGCTISILARREPKMVTFRLAKKGLAIDDTLYPVNHLQSFWIEETVDRELLLIDTPRFMTPDLAIPLEGADIEAVYRWFITHEIPEREQHESLPLKLLEFFGF